MAPTSPARFAAVIVAAGTGSRARLDLPKQFAPYRGTTVLRFAVEALRRAGAGTVVVAHPVGMRGETVNCLAGIDDIVFTPGGATRQESVRLALEGLAEQAPAYVLIHDAARPDCPPEVVGRLLAALADHHAAIPVLPVVDSLAVAAGGVMADSADREA